MLRFGMINKLYLLLDFFLLLDFLLLLDFFEERLPPPSAPLNTFVGMSHKGK
jgi:hypothetical protein